MNPSSHNAIEGIDDALIERIVREVLRRLGPDSTLPRRDELPTHEYRIPDRVVTLEQLRACGSDVTSVVVGAKAIVTPAFVDELRDRRMKLVRCSQIVHTKSPKNSRPQDPAQVKRVTPASRGELVIARVDSAAGPGWDAVGRIGHATVNGGLQSVLSRLSSRLGGSSHAKGAGRGVMVTSAPAVAVYTACQMGLRAVYASSSRDIGEAHQQYDANLLVVDAHVSPTGALDSFLAGGQGAGHSKSHSANLSQRGLKR